MLDTLTCASCGHTEAHDAAGIGVCRHPGCGCDGPLQAEADTLTVQGRPLPARSRIVAIVGARACTPYGDHVAQQLAADLAANGYCVMSGLAYGIDAAAHRGALRIGGHTAAVLGTGVDVCYPRGNDTLYRQIVASGTLISAYPNGSAPTRLRFLERNRVIAELAGSVVLVEGAMRSGSASVAAACADLDTRLYAVPGPVTSITSALPHHLIATEQASLITSGDDLLERLERS